MQQEIAAFKFKLNSHPIPPLTPEIPPPGDGTPCAIAASANPEVKLALKAKPREAGTRTAEATVPHDSGEVSGQYELDEN